MCSRGAANRGILFTGEARGKAVRGADEKGGKGKPDLLFIHFSEPLEQLDICFVVFSLFFTSSSGIAVKQRTATAVSRVRIQPIPKLFFHNSSDAAKVPGSSPIATTFFFFTDCLPWQPWQRSQHKILLLSVSRHQTQV
jgi:hypothetical protein